MNTNNNDPMVSFFNVLKGNTDKVDYGLSENAATFRKEVSVNSDHDGLLMFRKMNEEKNNNKEKKSKINPTSSNKKEVNISERVSCSSCGKSIRRPSGGCSVMCSCGKVHG